MAVGVGGRAGGGARGGSNSGPGGRGVVARAGIAEGSGAAHAGGVAAGGAPLGLCADAEFCGGRDELGPGEGGLAGAEEGVFDRFANVGGGAVVEVEADADVGGVGERGVGHGRVGDEFPHQAGGVVWHAEEVGVVGCEVCEAEVG